MKTRHLLIAHAISTESPELVGWRWIRPREVNHGPITVVQYSAAWAR